MDQKETFQQLLEQHISSLNKLKKDKYVITHDMFGKILTILQQPKGAKCEQGSNFKFWCNKHFKVEEIGANQLLFCKKTSCPVTTKEDMYTTILQCHQRVGYSRRDKTWDEVKNNYAWIHRHIVQLFLDTCPDCIVRAPVKKAKATKPIISLGFLTRVQDRAVCFLAER